jgi:hypothetical protein
VPARWVRELSPSEWYRHPGAEAGSEAIGGLQRHHRPAPGLALGWRAVVARRAVAGAHAETVRDLFQDRVPRAERASPTRFGAELTRPGKASGPLFGGNLELLARTVGVLDFDLKGHVLLLEANKAAGLGMVDRAMTQLMMSGALDGVTGVALGCLEGSTAAS